MKKFILKLLILSTFYSSVSFFSNDIFSDVVYAANTVTLYSPDGKILESSSENVQANLNVGWYRDPVVYMYSNDGRTLVVKKSEIAAHEKVGWHLDPVVLMHAEDGRTMFVLRTKIQEQMSVGWSLEPTVKSTVTLYTPDGKTLDSPADNVAGNLTVGWYKEPVTYMYSADGRTSVVKTSEIDAHKNVGWFLEKVKPTVKLYSPDGKTLDSPADNVAGNLTVGWYKEPVTYMYSADGRTLVVKTSEIDAHKNVGWFLNPVNNTNNPFKLSEQEIINYVNLGKSFNDSQFYGNFFDDFHVPYSKVYSTTDERKDFYEYIFDKSSVNIHSPSYAATSFGFFNKDSSYNDFYSSNHYSIITSSELRIFLFGIFDFENFDIPTFNINFIQNNNALKATYGTSVNTASEHYSFENCYERSFFAFLDLDSFDPYKPIQIEISYFGDTKIIYDFTPIDYAR